MPTTSWNGNGQNISQIDTLTVTAISTGGTLSAVINGKSITYTCLVTDTLITAAAAWQALLSATSIVPPEFTEMTWANVAGTAVITATSNVAGTPFTLTKSQAGGATCTLTTTTANSSQSDVNNANNWIRNGVASLPQNDDDGVLANSSVPLLWNLDTLAAVLFRSFTRYQSFTGSVGLPEINPLGYVEYRPTYFQFGSNVGQLPITLGVTDGDAGSGPTRERYNVGIYRTNLIVISAGSPADTYSVRFLGTHANNTIKVVGVSVGCGMLPTEYTAGTVVVDKGTVDGGGTLDFGPGTTFTGTGGGGTYTIIGGTGTLLCTPASVVAQNNATLSLLANNGTYPSVSAIGGVQLTVLAPMTITSLTLQKSSNLDNSGNLGSVTIVSTTIDGDTCQINDPNNSITYTNAANVAGAVSSGPFVFTGPRTVKIV